MWRTESKVVLVCVQAYLRDGPYLTGLIIIKVNNQADSRLEVLIFA